MRRILTLNKQDWLRGLGISQYLENDGLFYAAKGIDVWRDIGLLQTGYSETDLTGAVIANAPTAFEGVSVNTVDYLYIYDSGGKIYRLATTDDSGLALKATIANSVGQDLALLEAKILYTQNTQVGTITSPAAASPTFTDNVGTGLTSSSIHPIAIGADKLAYIGDVDGVARFDGTTISLDVFTVPADQMVACLVNDGYYLVVGTRYNNSTTTTVGPDTSQSFVYFWDMGANTPLRIYNKEINGLIVKMVTRGGNTYIITTTGIYVCNINEPPKLLANDSQGIIGFPTVAGDAPTNKVDVYRDQVIWGVAAGDIYAYGSRHIKLPPVFSTPHTGLGIITALKAWNVGGGQRIYLGNNTPKLYVLKTGRDTSVNAQTAKIDLKRTWKILGCKVFTEPLASGDSLTVDVIGDAGTSIISAQTFTFAADGAKVSKLINTLNTSVDNRTDEVSIKLTFTAGAVKIKRFELYGEPEREYYTQI
mgnify:CR=1 FL=1